MNKLIKVFILLGVFLGLGVTCASAANSISFNPQTINLQPGSSQDVQIMVDSLPQGLAGYNITYSISDKNVAQITKVTFPSWAQLGENSAVPSGSVWMSCADLLTKVNASDPNVVLGTITITAGTNAGTSDLVIQPNLITADGGADLTNSVGLNPGKINVVGPAPTVTGISPTSGPEAGGTVVTVTGTNFNGATKVNFGANAGTNLVVVSDSQITATSPAGTGTVDVTVTTPSGTSATSNNGKFTYIPPTPTLKPTVYSVYPNSGPGVGGNKVTIYGKYFKGATGADFGTNAGTNLVVVSDSQITVTAPAGTGTVDVTVTTPGGKSTTSINTKYTYNAPRPTVTSLTPSNGLRTGGNTVTIGGTGLTGATRVKFGYYSATNLAVVSDTQITVTAPAGTGTVDVTVTTPGGTSITSANSKYTYNAPPRPTVTSLTPSNGLRTGGNTVTIGGTGLTGATRVKFGYYSATNLAVVSDTQITVTAPAGTGTVDVTVTTPGGTSTTSANSKYTYNTPPRPTVTSLTPSNGLRTGGNTVTIGGTGLTGATRVRFGYYSATNLAVVSDTQITVTAPAGTGTVDVTITTPGGTSTTSANSKYTYGYR